MIITLSSSSQSKTLPEIEKKLKELNCSYKLDTREGLSRIVLLGAHGLGEEDICQWPGVEKVEPLLHPYKLVSRAFQSQSTEITFSKGAILGGNRITPIAGLPMVQLGTDLEAFLHSLQQLGFPMAMLGLSRERTSPYSPRGLEPKELKAFYKILNSTSLDLVIPLHHELEIQEYSPFASAFFLPGPHMNNQALMQALVQANKPVFLARHPGASLEQWLLAAEHFLFQGLDQLILVDEGQKSLDPALPRSLDMISLLELHELTHLPVVLHLGHGFREQEKARAGALSGLVCGVQGLWLDMLPNFSSGAYGEAHSLTLAQGEMIWGQLSQGAKLMRKELFKKNLSVPKSPKPEERKRAGIKIAFQGELGAFSEEAVYTRFPREQVELFPKRRFRDVFQSVLEGKVDYAVLPFENSLGGSIHENYDLILEYPDVSIVGETQIRIQHNLIGLPETDLSQVKRVYSHPQGLIQSAEFLDQYPHWEQVPFYDTAGSVAHVKTQKDPSIVAIASAEAARVYGMKILVSGVETNHQNYTRFFVFAQKGTPNLGQETKASMVFSTANSPGALSECLTLLSQYGLNMKKLESRPIPGKPWVYMFYVDVDLPQDLGVFDRAVGELSKGTGDFKVLGIYPGAPSL